MPTLRSYSLISDHSPRTILVLKVHQKSTRSRQSHSLNIGSNKGVKGSSSSKGKEKVKNRAKEKQGEDFFANQRFKIPLNDLEVQRTTEFATGVVAYEAIPEMTQATEEVQDLLKERLLMNNEIDPEEEEEEEEKESDEENQGGLYVLRTLYSRSH